MISPAAATARCGSQQSTSAASIKPTAMLRGASCCRHRRGTIGSKPGKISVTDRIGAPQKVDRQPSAWRRARPTGHVRFFRSVRITIATRVVNNMFGFEQLCAWHAQLMPHLIACPNCMKAWEGVGHGTSSCSSGGVLYLLRESAPVKRECPCPSSGGLSLAECVRPPRSVSIDRMCDENTQAQKPEHCAHYVKHCGCPLVPSQLTERPGPCTVKIKVSVPGSPPAIEANVQQR